MSGDETLQKDHSESESEGEDDDEFDQVPDIDIDPSTLTPLSPEVISKQVSIVLHCMKRFSCYIYSYFIILGHYQPWFVIAFARWCARC